MIDDITTKRLDIFITEGRVTGIKTLKSNNVDVIPFLISLKYERFDIGSWELDHVKVKGFVRLKGGNPGKKVNTVT